MMVFLWIVLYLIIGFACAVGQVKIVLDSDPSDDYEICDWASGNMNWDDVAHVAKQITPSKDLTPGDAQEAWVNGENVVVVDN